MSKENVTKVYLTKREMEALLGAIQHVDSLPYTERTKIYGTTPAKVLDLVGKLQMALYPDLGIPQ